jgi:membrane fusion protein, copper/silver efflux system
VIFLVVAAYFLFPSRQERIVEGADKTPQATGKTTSGPAPGPPTSGNGVLGADESSAVEIPLEKQQVVRIKTVAATVRPIHKTLRTVGRVEIDETKVTTVNIKVEGWVETLHADYVGKYVEKGTPLAEIYSPELTAIQLEYLNLLSMMKPVLGFRPQRTVEFSWGDRYGTVGRTTTYELETLLDVAKQKFALWEIPEKEIKELEATRKPMKTLTVKSPASGYVFQKPVVKGTRVAPGDKILDIVDLSTVWVLADIYEYEIPFVKVGQNARITLSYYPGKTFSTPVDFIYPTLSGQTRTMKVRFAIPNPDGLLKPQMFTNVEMELNLGKRLVIPETAVLDTGTRQIVYVDTGEGSFAAREIKAGDRGGGMCEVLGGLKAGEKVASSAVFLIDSEAKLKGISP